MTKDEFKQMLAMMVALWPKWRSQICPDAPSKNAWLACLMDIDYRQAEMALRSLACTSDYPPSIAEIRKTVAQQTAPKSALLSEPEAWALVEKAITRSSYYATEEYDKLPAAVQRAVGSPGVLQEMARDEHPNIQSMRTSFGIAYRSIAEQQKHEAQISTELRQRIEMLRQKDPEPKRINTAAEPMQERTVMSSRAEEMVAEFMRRRGMA